MLLTAPLLLLLAVLVLQEEAGGRPQRDFVATADGALHYIYAGRHYPLPADVTLEDLFDSAHAPYKARLVSINSSIATYAEQHGYGQGLTRMNSSAGHFFKRSSDSLDEVMGEFLRKLQLLQPVQPIKRVLVKAERFNMAIVAFAGGVLCSHRGKNWVDASVYFSWLGLSVDGAAGSRADGLGLSAQDLSTLNGSFFGTEDARFILSPYSNSSLVAYSTSIYKRVGQTMFNVVSATEITAEPPVDVTAAAPLLRVSSHFKLMTADEGHLPASLHQKSWVPFEYNGSVLLIKHIQPLTVLRLADEGPLRNHRMFDALLARTYNASEAFLPCQVVSQHSCPQVHRVWEYGELRGGSNAVLLPRRGEYLALFHTRSPMRHRDRKRITYFMGAFTFSAHPPFRLRGISFVPLALDEWYQGEWFPSRHVDYVIFPTSLLVDEAAGAATAAVGHNDRDSFVVQLDLGALLDSITPLDCE